jgi:hypothetical protein
MLFDNSVYRFNSTSHWKEQYPSESATLKLAKLRVYRTHILNTNILYTLLYGTI